jgi:hypothetical protein
MRKRFMMTLLAKVLIYYTSLGPKFAGRACHRERSVAITQTMEIAALPSIARMTQFSGIGIVYQEFLANPWLAIEFRVVDIGLRPGMSFFVMGSIDSEPKGSIGCAARKTKFFFYDDVMQVIIYL